MVAKVQSVEAGRRGTFFLLLFYGQDLTLSLTGVRPTTAHVPDIAYHRGEDYPPSHCGERRKFLPHHYGSSWGENFRTGCRPSDGGHRGLVFSCQGASIRMARQACASQ